jgi:hypothetical protein
MEKNLTSRYTAKDAEKYGQDIFSGLRKLLNKDKTINPFFEEEIKRLTEAIVANKNNLNWDDLQILEHLATKTYNAR